ncbi:hypothetical protein LguiB_010422 [Lonicera macranthoides]
MDSHIEEMEGLLNSDSNGLRIIGILGMGGLGKTTIAKVIYNKLSELYECRCFLEDVRERSEHHNGIVDLQTQILSEILKRETSKIDNDYKGLDKIKDAVHGKKVFLVLDDVDKISQIEKLVGNHNWYDARSKIIITTRNKEVLEELELTCQKEGLHEVYMSYEPDFMNHDHSLELFSKYAFKEDSPPEGYNALAVEVVSSAGGLPLVLVTLGSLLFIEKDKVSWQHKLKKLQALPPPEVLGRLRISYDALDNAQQQIFLDISCLFSGVDKTNPYYMWDDCKFYPWEGINALVRRSLITVRDDNRVWMHDRLRELGEQIICEKYRDEPGKWSRLWRYEDAWNILKRHLGSKKVKVLSLPSSGFEESKDDVDILRQELGKLRLRFLGCEEEDFHDFEKPTRHLLGRDFGKLPNLRYLRMDLIDLDGDFENLLQNLRWLQWWCSGNCAPTNLNMENLIVLDLSLSKITDDWGAWSQIKMSKKLKVLNLSGCFYLSSAPHLSAFPALERLELEGCSSLCGLDGLEELKLLEQLNISSCASLKKIPDLSHLKKLRKLNSGFLQLTEVQGLAGLESLEHLNMNYWENIERLSDLSKLRWLRKLKISSCCNLIEIQGLDGLESLELLDMRNCISIKRLQDLSNLKRLKKLNISECKKLIEIQDLDGLESLQTLDMSYCQSLEKLPNLSNLRKLKHLNINSCCVLIEIQSLDRLESLEHLDMGFCESIEILPDLPNFGMLNDIDMYCCKSLYEVESLRAVESLESLNASWCQALENMPDLTILKNLKKLNISYLEKLTKLQGLEELKSLESLDVRGCKSMESLPDFSNVTNLKELDVSYCARLTEIRGLEELKFLRELRIVGCELLENLPSLPDTTIYKD